MTTPNGCTHCGVEQREHMQRWKLPARWHVWEQPTQAQILARMQERRAQRQTRRELSALGIPAIDAGQFRDAAMAIEAGLYEPDRYSS